MRKLMLCLVLAAVLVFAVTAGAVANTGPPTAIQRVNPERTSTLLVLAIFAVVALRLAADGHQKLLDIIRNRYGWQREHEWGPAKIFRLGAGLISGRYTIRRMSEGGWTYNVS